MHDSTSQLPKGINRTTELDLKRLRFHLAKSMENKIETTDYFLLALQKYLAPAATSRRTSWVLRLGDSDI